ncbi:hypothetical protein HPB48_007295 [Haemaphysalis longicornis]|uniref:Uncharacterized protein n=1 Tax=Haemaphysalis longicornis TaxID=44386 RepID=A0A9J6GWA0_HAELO|nr:hypothetical protein HPB48_007295 [Haemaphysalis longicornis]
MRQVIKKLLHLPASFPDITIHLPHRAGGLGALELARVAAECQLKAFARLQRLNSSTIDAVLEGSLMDCRGALGDSLGVPHAISGAEEVFAAVDGARKEHWRQWKARYSNSSLFAFEGDRLGNRWLRPGAGHMGDGDKIKSLRLRTNLFPTRTLSNKHAADPRARLCRRCGQKEETASTYSRSVHLSRPRVARVTIT